MSQPAEAAIEAGQGRETGRGLRQLLRPYRGRLLAALIAIAVTSMLGVTSPVLIRLAFDRALFCSAGCLNNNTLVLLVVVLVAIPVLSAAVAVVHTYLVNSVGHQLARDLRVMVIRHVGDAPLAFRRSAAGRSVSRFITGELEQVEAAVSEVGGGMIGGAAGCVVALVVSLVMSWRLSLVLLPLLPAFVALTNRLLSRRSQLIGQSSRLRVRLGELVTGLVLPTRLDRPGGAGRPAGPGGPRGAGGAGVPDGPGGAGGAGGAGLAELDAVSLRLARIDSGAALFGSPLLVLVQTLFAIAPALAYLGYVLVLTTRAFHLSIGTLVAFSTLQMRFLASVIRLLQARQQVAPARDLVERSFAFGQLPSRRDRGLRTSIPRPGIGSAIAIDGAWARELLPGGGADETAPPLAGRIEAVADAPLDGEQWSLRGLSFGVRAGQVAALVGPSEPSLAMIGLLLQRGVDPDAGMVRIGGCDLRTVMPDAVDSAVMLIGEGAVTYPIDGTLRENLAALRPDAGQAELEQAAQAAGLDRRISRLPKGWNTRVGDGGYRLDTVDHRLLTITQAHLHHPYVLILNNLTRGLDPDDAALVARGAGALVPDVTTILIAERLPAVTTADLIVVIEHGQVSASGSHAWLMAESEWYASTYRRQIAG